MPIMKKNRRFWRAASSSAAAAAAARLNSSSRSSSSSSNDNTNINNNNSVSSSTTTMQRLQLGECVPYQAPVTPEQVQLKRVVVVTIATSTRKCNNNASETIGASTASGETKESTAKTAATITSSTDADQLQEPTENINNISKHHDFDDDEDDGGDDKEEDCPICLEILDRSSYYHHSHHHHHHHYTSPKVVVKLKTCQHTFHQACLQDSWKHQNTVQCPVCRIPAVEQTFGKSPSGTMMVSILLPRTTCPGFSSSTTTQTLQLQYTIPSGVQQSYHEHPGQAYHGTTRIAYLPYNKEGLQLLQRLVYAFEHGYTFQVGTSLTTGRPNSVIWSSIHHKTSLHGGVHGFPDASYLENCHGSLDALHIPPVTATATGTAAATMTATAAQNERTWNSWTNPSSFPFQVHYHAPTSILPSMEDAMILLSPRGAMSHKKCPKHFQNGVVSSSSHSDNLAMMPDGKHQVSNNNCCCCCCDYDTYCSKCHNAITGDTTTTTTALCISTCQHIFHESCWMPPTWNCPICHAMVVAPNQTSPSGILQLRILSNQTCPGFDSNNNNNNNNTKVMECRYEIPPNQIQQPYHPNPGLSIPSTTRITYLPFNEQGCDLYIRLRYAWKNGYIFKIGTSLTTGKSNVVVWNAAIPHKTSLHGGLFGFPDASYLMACHAALDALEIPDSTACWEKWEQERVGNTNR